jgi:hypothetical protein
MPTMTPTATSYTCTWVGRSPAKAKKRPKDTFGRFAPGTQRIVGLTVINAHQVLDRDGRLIVTVPETVEATAEDLAPALQAA